MPVIVRIGPGSGRGVLLLRIIFFVPRNDGSTDLILKFSLKSRTKAIFLLSGRYQGFICYGFRVNLTILRHTLLTICNDKDFRFSRIGDSFFGPCTGGDLGFEVLILVYWKVMWGGGHTKQSLWGWEFLALNLRRMGSTGIWSWIPATPA